MARYYFRYATFSPPAAIFAIEALLIFAPPRHFTPRCRYAAAADALCRRAAMPPIANSAAIATMMSCCADFSLCRYYFIRERR